MPKLHDYIPPHKRRKSTKNSSQKSKGGITRIIHKKKPVCIACSDTGKASNGDPCYPCMVHGRLRKG